MTLYRNIIFLLITTCISWSWAANQITSSSIKGPVAPQRRDVPGTRISISLGKIYQPEYYQTSTDGKYSLVVFFHGASWCAEQNLYDSGKEAILLSVNTLDYMSTFHNTKRFDELLTEVSLALSSTWGIPSTFRKELVLISFSGGYLAIREILSKPEYYNEIDGVILADSLYTRFLDVERTKPHPDDIAPFLRFAQDAASSKKQFWFTQLYPPEWRYRNNSTTRTAVYLHDKLKLSKRPRNETNTLGMTLLYSAETGKCHIMGYQGMTTQDHFNHFYNLTEYIRKLE